MLSRPDDYIGKRLDERSEIPCTHRDQLDVLAESITANRPSGRTTRLVFICTHNSRRSQMAQVWAQTAANHFSVSPIEAYSAGTEATAFNERAVAALQRAGCAIERRVDGENPTYEFRTSTSEKPVTLFSKDLSEPSLPKSFTAVMTCSTADDACPTVHGARARVALPYDDPKVADDTPEEPATYDECCRQISRDLLYLFSQIRPQRSGEFRTVAQSVRDNHGAQSYWCLLGLTSPEDLRM